MGLHVSGLYDGLHPLQYMGHVKPQVHNEEMEYRSASCLLNKDKVSIKRIIQT